MPIYMPKIMTIQEYWNLIGREQFLAITWEPDFSQACSFCRMFHFAQTPDKTNDMIFLKSPKTMFLGHFWPFSAVTHNYIWAPNTMLSFRKKLMSQFWENVRTDGTTDGRTDGRTERPYFIGPFRSRQGVQ